VGLLTSDGDDHGDPSSPTPGGGGVERVSGQHRSGHDHTVGSSPGSHIAPGPYPSITLWDDLAPLPTGNQVDEGRPPEHSGPMRSVGRWGIDLTMPQSLLLALHLRDAAGLRPATSPLLPDFPPLDPAAIPLRTAGADVAGLEAASRQWATWWARSFPGGADALTSILPPRYPGLNGMPELHGLAELGMDDAVTWCGRARETERRIISRTATALFETNLLTEVEHDLGRRIRPFSLQVVVLPFAGAHHWDVLGQPVISLGLRADRDAYLRWLREQLLRIGHLRFGVGDRTEQP
jgi:hypothetical protein